MRAICFSFIFSSVLSSLQGYGFSLWSAGSSGRSGSAEPLSCGLWCHSGVFPAIPLFLHSAYVLAVQAGVAFLSEAPEDNGRSLITFVLTGSLAFEVGRCGRAFDFLHFFHTRLWNG